MLSTGHGLHHTVDHSIPMVSPVIVYDKAFHEKAGQCQACCLRQFIFFFSSSGDFAERPGAVKGALGAAQRTLDGEDRSASIPLGRKENTPRLIPASRCPCHCRHPSIRTLGERCSLGASWVFSFQPVLPPVRRPVFHGKHGSWARR
jgi:hypothetical protein